MSSGSHIALVVERHESVDSTNDVARERLAAGAVAPLLVRAESQRAGRGRRGRTWLDSPGTALLLSLGVRADARGPLSSDPARAWRVAAEFALAAADAIEDAAGLQLGAVALKWPNDLVLRKVEGGTTRNFRKIGGVLSEASNLGAPDASLVVGLGINVRGDIARLDANLAATATSLEIATGRPVDREALFLDLVARLEGRLGALAAGRFDVAGWRSRQLLDGCEVEVDLGGEGIVTGQVMGHDGASGAMILSVDGIERAIEMGEVARVLRIAIP